MINLCSSLFRGLCSFAANDKGATSIEYAIIASGIAVVIATTVSMVGTNLLPLYERVAAAFN